MWEIETALELPLEVAIMRPTHRTRLDTAAGGIARDKSHYSPLEKQTRAKVAIPTTPSKGADTETAGLSNGKTGVFDLWSLMHLS